MVQRVAQMTCIRYVHGIENFNVNINICFQYNLSIKFVKLIYRKKKLFVKFVTEMNYLCSVTILPISGKGFQPPTPRL